MRAISCAAFFYPAYFFALTLVNWAPVVFVGADARDLRLTPAYFGQGVLRLWGDLAIAITLGACLLTWVALRGRPFVAGLLIACIAHAGLRNSALALWFGRGQRWWEIAGVLVCVVLLAAGFRLLRPGPLAAGFLVPLAVTSYVTTRRPEIVLLYSAPVLLAGILTRSRFTRSHQAPHAPPWTPAGCGKRPGNRFLRSRLGKASAYLQHFAEPRPEGAVPQEPFFRTLLGVAASVCLYATTYAGGAALDRAKAVKQREARAAVMSGVPAIDRNQPYAKVFFQRGVNLTAEFPDGYRPQSAVLMLEKLLSQGVNSVALVPYGFSPGLQSTQIRFGASLESPDDIAAIAALAHQRGMHVLLKPQIWLGRGGFPGDVEITDPEERTKWFESYRTFLEFYARLAAQIHADVFCVGVELAKMTKHESEWRALIARARELYSGPLVYAAIQGPEFETIRFWDALDYIGLNNYYPLPDDLSTEAVVRKVEDVQRRYNKPVIFPEAGFASLKDPHRAPWDETPRALSPADQARCYEAILRAFYKKPWFQGVYWWKVGTNGYGGIEDSSHTPWRKPAMDVVAHWYTQGGR